MLNILSFPNRNGIHPNYVQWTHHISTLQQARNETALLAHQHYTGQHRSIIQQQQRHYERQLNELKSQNTALRDEVKRLQTDMRKGVRSFMKTRGELTVLQRKYERIFSVPPGKVMDTERREPTAHHMSEMVDYIKTILWGNSRYDCSFDDTLEIMDRVMKYQHFTPFRVSDCVYAISAVSDYFARMGTGSGAGSNREHLKATQTVAASLMYLTRGGQIKNKTLFTGVGANILPHESRVHRGPFVDDCRRRRHSFNINENCRTLCKDYSNETREPSTYRICKSSHQN